MFSFDLIQLYSYLIEQLIINLYIKKKNKNYYPFKTFPPSNPFE